MLQDALPNPSTCVTLLMRFMICLETSATPERSKCRLRKAANSLLTLLASGGGSGREEAVRGEEGNDKEEEEELGPQTIKSKIAQKN